MKAAANTAGNRWTNTVKAAANTAGNRRTDRVKASSSAGGSAPLTLPLDRLVDGGEPVRVSTRPAT
ncbi:hypothetical protein [Nonomuraea sp. NPDC003754]